MHTQPGGGEKIHYSRSPEQGLTYRDYIKTKSEDGNHLLITHCNRACFAKSAPRGFREDLNGPAGPFSYYYEEVVLWVNS